MNIIEEKTTREQMYGQNTTWSNELSERRADTISTHEGAPNSETRMHTTPQGSVSTGSPVTWWQQLESGNDSDDHSFNAIDLFRSPPDIKNIRVVRSCSLVAVDFLTLLAVGIVSVLICEWLRPYISVNPEVPLIPDSLLIQFTMFVLPVAFVMMFSTMAGNYSTCKPLWIEAQEYLKATIYAVGGTAIFLFFLDIHFSRLLLVTFWILAVVALPSARYLCKSYLLKAGYWFLPAAIFGTGDNALKLHKSIQSNKWLGLKVLAFVEIDETVESTSNVPSKMIINSVKDQRFEVFRYGQPHILFAPETQREYEAAKPLLNHINSTLKSVTIVPPFYGLPLGGAEIFHVPRSDSMFLSLKNNLLKTENIIVKRIIDLILATAALLILSPAFLIISCILLLEDGPVFYGQPRVGRKNRRFYCLKFRTMIPNSEKKLEEYLSENQDARKEWDQNRKLKNDPRVTAIGKFLRKTSLDEIPQLINVIKNEMSLVGPRPIVDVELEKYGEMLPYYMSSNPGITGIWQTSGRSDTSYEERVSLDVWYARNWSLWLDMVILAKTLPAVVRTREAY